MEHGRYVITPEQVRDAVDENTIGVVAILGTTFTGELEPVAEIAEALDEIAAGGGPDVPLHVDAASGGFVVPPAPGVEVGFPDSSGCIDQCQWPQIRYDLSGIGFVVWRSKEHLPEELVFRVNYLGGDMPTFTLNFSRSGNQVVGQYYNFIRLGVAGYTQIMESLRDTALMLSEQISKIDNMEIITDGSAIPVLSFQVVGDPGFTVFDISHELRARGFQVPAYTMPADAEDIAVLRVVLREGFSRDLAYKLSEAITDVVDRLRAGVGTGHTARGFAH